MSLWKFARLLTTTHPLYPLYIQVQRVSSREGLRVDLGRVTVTQIEVRELDVGEIKHKVYKILFIIIWWLYIINKRFLSADVHR